MGRYYCFVRILLCTRRGSCGTIEILASSDRRAHDRNKINFTIFINIYIRTGIEKKKKYDVVKNVRYYIVAKESFGEEEKNRSRIARGRIIIILLRFRYVFELRMQVRVHHRACGLPFFSHSHVTGFIRSKQQRRRRYYEGWQDVQHCTANLKNKKNKSRDRSVAPLLWVGHWSLEVAVQTYCCSISESATTPREKTIPSERSCKRLGVRNPTILRNESFWKMFFP